jgi:hypothetical protein
MAEWLPIATAWTNPTVTGSQATLFVARFGKERYPSFNCVYYDHLQADAGETHPWIFADGGGAYHRDWPTHWMFAGAAAPVPKDANGQTAEKNQ